VITDYALLHLPPLRFFLVLCRRPGARRMLGSNQTSIATVRKHLSAIASVPTPLPFHYQQLQSFRWRQVSYRYWWIKLFGSMVYILGPSEIHCPDWSEHGASSGPLSIGYL